MHSARKGTAHSHDAHVGASHGVHHHFVRPNGILERLGISPGMHIADFGAGSGVYVLGAAHILDNKGHIYAIDVQKDLLRRIKNEAERRGFKNVETIWGDLEVAHGSKIKDHTLELVIVSNILFQMDNPANVLREAYRVLRPNGRIAIIEWSDSPASALPMGPHKDDVVTESKARHAAESVGFTFVESFGAGAHHYGLLLRKAKK